MMNIETLEDILTCNKDAAPKMSHDENVLTKRQVLEQLASQPTGTNDQNPGRREGGRGVQTSTAGRG